MLSFEEIEDCFPDGACSDDATGNTLVSAQWLHDFAHAVAAKEREACAKICDAASQGRGGWAGDCADRIRMRSNV